MEIIDWGLMNQLRYSEVARQILDYSSFSENHLPMIDCLLRLKSWQEVL